MIGYICAKCGGQPGADSHWTTFCVMTEVTREFHFCCPENCELEEAGS